MGQCINRSILNFHLLADTGIYYLCPIHPPFTFIVISLQSKFSKLCYFPLTGFLTRMLTGISGAMLGLQRLATPPYHLASPGPHRISSWLQGIQASSTLPPLSIPTAGHAEPLPRPSISGYKLAPLPIEKKHSIMRQLSFFLGGDHNPQTALQTLPSPITNPLVCIGPAS